MSVIDRLTNAKAELDLLLPLRARLTQALELHADRLQAVGAIPSEALVADLQEYRRRLVDVAFSLPAESKPGVPSGSDIDDLSWVSLQNRLQRCHALVQATELLSHVNRLRHKDDSAFAPLLECRQNADRLRLEIDTANDSEAPTLDDLNSGRHPFSSLLTLVANGPDLPDEQWTELNDRVIESFGRPMATAVARGKIELAPNDVVLSDVLLSAVESSPVDTLSEVVPTAADCVEDSVVSDVGGTSTETATAEESSRLLEVDASVPADVSTPTSEIVSEPVEAENETSTSIFETSVPTVPNRLMPPQSESLRQEYNAQATAGACAISTRPNSALNASTEESIFGSIGSTSTVKAPSRNYRATDVKLISEEPYNWLQKVSSRAPNATVMRAHVAPHDVRLLARNASRAEGDARHAPLSQLILQLLSEDRLVLAYHLTRGIEHRLKGFQTNLPSWLIHALVLSRHICYAKGQIARQIDEDLKEFSPQLLTAGDAEWNEATGFFVRAAALIPALLTSSGTASAILRSFRITPGLSHLYNYCSRLSTYGQRLQGQASDLFTPDCDMANWEGEIAKLQQTVETWLTDSIKEACPTSRSSLLFLHAHWTLTNGSISRYTEAARLWSKWQECFRLVHRLLRPVRFGQEHERNWVKSEIDRLTQSARIEPTGTDAGQALPVGTLSFPLEAMLKVIREAVDFASRWLRLCASKPAQGRTLASRDAEALRDDILERTDAVVAELEVFTQRQTSQRLRAGIACLRGTIEHMRSIFSPHSTLALREVDPRHVVYGELLKIPHLKMNDQWIPTVEPLALENEILAYLSGDARDWKQAFECQSTQRDHVATERILELNVWRTEQERDALRRKRSGEIRVCREDLERDLEELRQCIAESAHQLRFNEPFTLSLTKQLQKIQTDADSNVDFAAMQDEVSRLRLSLERQKRETSNVPKRVEAMIELSTSAVSTPHEEPTDAEQTSDTDSWAQNIFSDS